MKSGVLTKAVAAGCLLFLVVPTVIVVLASFSGSPQIEFPPSSWTLSWYSSMLADTEVWRTLGNSAILGVIVVVVDVLIAIPAMLAVHRYRLRGSRAANALLSMGLTTPLIVTALAFLVVFTTVGVSGQLLPIGIALSVVNLPFMLWAVGSAVASLDTSLEEAAATLGANRRRRFILILLPQLAPGIITGSLLVFVLTVTDFVVSVILVNVQSMTLPVYVYSGLRSTVSPGLAATSVLFIVVVTVVFAAVLRFGRIDTFLKRPLD